MMPSFDKKLRPEAILALVGHIRSFGPAPAAAQPQAATPEVQGEGVNAGSSESATP